MFATSDSSADTDTGSSVIPLVAYDSHSCEFGNFRDNSIFVDSVKRQICDVKIRDYDTINLHLDRIISRGFIFTNLRICEVSRK